VKGFIVVVVALCLMGCGLSSTQNELVGQVKKVTNQTPLICPNRIDADISLGVMRNGVGSMSAQDMWFTVEKESDQELLRKAAEAGSIVKVLYDVHRVTLCQEAHRITHVELAK
jgi:hypothetical protein